MTDISAGTAVPATGPVVPEQADRPEGRRLEMTTLLTQARTALPVLRSIGAVVAGFLTIGVLSTAADQLLHATGVFPPDGQPMYDNGLFAVALAYRTLFGILAGFVTAWLAPSHPIRHALALGIVGVVLSTIGAVVMWDMGPGWYPIAVILICLPTAWFGASLQMRRMR
jgi:hypothetical protein